MAHINKVDTAIQKTVVEKKQGAKQYIPLTVFKGYKHTDICMIYFSSEKTQKKLIVATYGEVGTEGNLIFHLIFLHYLNLSFLGITVMLVNKYVT